MWNQDKQRIVLMNPTCNTNKGQLIGPERACSCLFMSEGERRLHLALMCAAWCSLAVWCQYSQPPLGWHYILSKQDPSWLVCYSPALSGRHRLNIMTQGYFHEYNLHTQATMNVIITNMISIVFLGCGNNKIVRDKLFIVMFRDTGS